MWHEGPWQSVALTKAFPKRMRSEGHGFSRANTLHNIARALAPEVGFVRSARNKRTSAAKAAYFLSLVGAAKAVPFYLRSIALQSSFHLCAASSLLHTLAFAGARHAA